MRPHRGVEGVQARSAGALALRPREQGDAFVAVLDEMVDEQRDPPLVVERDRTLAGAFNYSVEEDRRGRRGAHSAVEE